MGLSQRGKGCSSWWKNICQLELGREELSNSYSVKEEYKKIMEDDLSHDNSHWVKMISSAFQNGCMAHLEQFEVTGSSGVVTSCTSHSLHNLCSACKCASVLEE
ncbi:hypothetical protein TSUD_95740 [Trifolium subterraneum]|uniref:Uncharacterized protein n=1 Tax=Trifolium subterraneum TaxID=3900 RepID=A0A2Z6PAK6_TRISU|nr:hypothetical protein TSUD_95740 [Trifolium subterraneum]